MESVGQIIKKIVLFLSGIILIVWGYRANDEALQDEDEAERTIQSGKGVGTSTEIDQPEQSSGSI